METILETLYDGAYRPRSCPTEEYNKLRREHMALLDQIEKAFSWGFVDKLETVEGLLTAETELSAFRHGFHLGASLMLELLYAPPR